MNRDKQKSSSLSSEEKSMLAQRREELGLTQRQLSEKSGISIQTISNIEQGRYKTERLEWQQFISLCLALNWHEVEKVPKQLGPKKR
jgi:transcriptional regulator with XRE-family HTH domain